MTDRSDSMPATQKGGLTVTALDDEILVYDPETMRASCLNSFAAEVLALCDGQRSAPVIARDLPFDDVDERMVWLALADLEKAQLLQDRSSFASNPYARMNRRELLRRIGSGAGVAVSVVAAVTLPPIAAHASHEGCIHTGQLCDSIPGLQCCSGSCDNNECVPN